MMNKIDFLRVFAGLVFVVGIVEGKEYMSCSVGVQLSVYTCFGVGN